MNGLARLVGVAFLALLPMTAAGTTSSASGGSAHPVPDEPVDFVRFNGAVYLSLAHLAGPDPARPSPSIEAERLGPVVGRVVTDRVDRNAEVAYPNEPCSWGSPDGTAPRLAVGDELYAVRDYTTMFRLAARRGGEVVLYQVWCSDWAKVGADLFDIRTRVERISVTGDLSESSGWATIGDRAAVDGLVDMLLAGRILSEEPAPTSPPSHQLILHLDDGTAFRASAAAGAFLWGLGAVAVPPAFDEGLDRAWTGHLGVGTPAATGPDRAA